MQLGDFLPGTVKHTVVEAGNIIFLEGQPARTAYVILKGYADVVVQNAAGDYVPLNRMGPGELFGEIAILSDQKARTATVMAADHCELLEINREVFDNRVAKSDPLVRFVLDHMTRRMMQLTDKITKEKKPG
jgi:CRP-like cAMP-binding protein